MTRHPPDDQARLMSNAEPPTVDMTCCAIQVHRDPDSECLDHKAVSQLSKFQVTENDDEYKSQKREDEHRQQMVRSLSEMLKLIVYNA
jgi:hypothetical protein